MHIYFSGIGGTAIGPLAMIAKQAGYDVSGSDMQESSYLDNLRKKGITNIHVGQTAEQIAKVHQLKPIDWFVYSSALPKTMPNHPELIFCEHYGIKSSKRDEFLNKLLEDKKQQMIAIAGTHGKTTTTAMVIWLFKQLGVPASYSVGAKIPFGEMGEFDPSAKYFIYEADEYDRNFLSFYPGLSTITGLDWDHPDIYPTRESYTQAFSEFLDQSETAILWQEDAEILGLSPSDKYQIIDSKEPAIDQDIKLAGWVNRANAWQALKVTERITGRPAKELLVVINKFPGVSRRFEVISKNIHSDYAHTPPKIRGALQIAREVAGDNVVVIYEGLHNTRQHFIKDELKNLFNDVKKLYIVPSYLAREDKNLELLTPDKLLNMLSNEAKAHAQAAVLGNELKDVISDHVKKGDLVLALSAGGGGSLDEWLRKNF